MGLAGAGRSAGNDGENLGEDQVLKECRLTSIAYRCNRYLYITPVVYEHFKVTAHFGN
jgi:hypothetical protein